MPVRTIYDVVILGAGPAGLQAAIHAARKKAAVLVLGRMGKSSLFHAHVENYAFLFNTTGEEMLRVGTEQAQQFGAELLEEDVLQMAPEGQLFAIKLEGGASIQTKSLIIATGTTRKMLGAPGEKELLGRGVSYCVDCDGNFFRGQDVAVIGGQSAAVGGALTLAQLAGQVHLVCDQLQIAEALQSDLMQSRVVLHEGRRVKAINGQDQVTGLKLDDGTHLTVSGVFIELGAKGVMELAGHLNLRLDDQMKYIDTNKQQETSVAGIYAAGDITGPPWQIAKAVGEGCVAGIRAANYAKKLKLEKQGGE